MSNSKKMVVFLFLLFVLAVSSPDWGNLRVEDLDPEVSSLKAIVPVNAAKLLSINAIESLTWQNFTWQNLFWHDDDAYITFSPDSRLLAVGSRDRDITVWNTTDGKCVNVFAFTWITINCIDFDSTGELLVTGSSDTTVRIWNITSGRAVHVLYGHTDQVNSVKFDPSGKLLASGSTDTTVRIWNVTFGEQVRVINDHPHAVTGVEFDPSGKVLASGSYGFPYEGYVKFHDVLSGNETLSLNDSVSSIAFSPDGRLLATCGSYFIKIWNLTEKSLYREIFNVDCCALVVTSVDFMGDGKHLVAATKVFSLLPNGAGLLIDLHTGETIETQPFEGASIECVSCSPDGEKIALGLSNGTVMLLKKIVEEEPVSSNTSSSSSTSSSGSSSSAFESSSTGVTTRGYTGMTVFLALAAATVTVTGRKRRK
ncbi:MAG: WD40 repeat domain-containing protein [Candidatus Odinarchaeota archaeon]